MLSIVIPAYNVERYLNRCMESVLSQSYEDLEILLINDGSTDGTGSLCTEFAKRDSRIVYVEKQNEGQAVARNIGIRMARGEYLTFLDADDWMEQDFAKCMLEAIRGAEEELGEAAGKIRPDGKGPAVIAVCDIRYKDAETGEETVSEIRMPEGVLWKVDEHRDLINRTRTFLWGKVYRTENVRDCGVELPVGVIEDFPVTSILTARAEAVVRVAMPLINYLRNRTGNSSSDAEVVCQRYCGGIRILCDNFNKAGMFQVYEKELYKLAYSQARFSLMTVKRMQKEKRATEEQYKNHEIAMKELLREIWPERTSPIGVRIGYNSEGTLQDRIEKALKLVVVSEEQLVDMGMYPQQKVNIIFRPERIKAESIREDEMLSEEAACWALADEILFSL